MPDVPVPAVGRDDARRSASPPTDRVVAVVSLLAAQPERTFTLTEVARSADVPVATCHAILARLAAAGWVTRSTEHTGHREGRGGSAGYGLGPALSAVAQAAASGRPAGRAAEPELRRLRADTGIVASVSVLEADAITVVAATDARLTGHRVLFVPPIGTVFAAWGGQRDIWLPRFDPHTADRDVLSEAIDRTRRRGYVIERFTPTFLKLRGILEEVVDDQRLQDAARELFAKLGFADFLPDAPPPGAEETIDVTILGAPIFGPSGLAVANLSLHPGIELDRGRLVELATELVAAADRVTASIGGRRA